MAIFPFGSANHESGADVHLAKDLWHKFSFTNATAKLDLSTSKNCNARQKWKTAKSIGQHEEKTEANREPSSIETAKKFQSTRLLVTMWFGELLLLFLFISFACCMSPSHSITYSCAALVSFSCDINNAVFYMLPFPKFAVANVGNNYAIDRSVSSACECMSDYGCAFCLSFIPMCHCIRSDRMKRRWYEHSCAPAHFAIQIQVFEYTAFTMTSRHTKGHYKLLNERHNTAKDLTATTTITTKYWRSEKRMERDINWPERWAQRMQNIWATHILRASLFMCWAFFCCRSLCRSTSLGSPLCVFSVLFVTFCCVNALAEQRRLLCMQTERERERERATETPNMPGHYICNFKETTNTNGNNGMLNRSSK